MASISFPTNPTNGDTYTYNGVTYEFNSAKSQWIIQVGTSLADVNINGIGGSMIPSANVTHDLGTADKAWRDLYLSGSSINLGGQTITATESGIVLPEGSTVGDISLGAGGATQYANTSVLPTSGLTAGQFAFVGNTLFMTNGTGWYSVALINQTPELTLSTSNISLGADGNTIDFTFTATDPDGPTPTVTVTTTANSAQANITLYTSNNTVTVENLSADDYSANITLTASDGINQTFGTVTLTVVYLVEVWDETVLSIGTSSTNSLDNSTFIDRSTNAQSVTTIGTPTQSTFHPYLDNWSVEFDGTTADYIRFDNSTNALYGSSNDITIECWIYPRTSTVTGIFDGTSGVTDGLRQYRPNRVGKQQTSIDYDIEFAITPFKWQHFAFVADTTNWRVYIDGVQQNTVSTVSYSARTTFDIGTINGGASGKFNGYISDFRITTAGVYTSNFTPPSRLGEITNTTLLACNSNRLINHDTSYNGSVTINGNPVVSSYNPFGQESEYAVAENKGSHLTIVGSTVETTLSSGLEGDMTLEMWWYPTTSTTAAYIFDFLSPRFSLYYEWSGGGSGQDYSFDAYDTGYKTFASGSNQHPNIVGQWNHLAYVRTSGVWRLYVNGIQTTSTITNSSDFSNSSVSIGAPYSSRNQGQAIINAYFSDLKVSPSAVYSSNFTPPTAPVGNTNASLYLPMDNAGIFDKTGNHDLILFGDTSTSTTQTKFADTAIYFDGSGDYITEEASESYGYGTLDFTIEYWMYLIGTGTRTVFSNLSSASGTQPHMYTNGTDLRYYTAGADQLATGSLNTDQWYHVALCRSSSSTRLFIDGTQVGGTLADTYDYGSTAPLGIGTYHNPTPVTTSTMSGYLENIQVLKGVAKYTTNFTPPTGTQGRMYQAES